jgi:hypothetical protein
MDTILFVVYIPILLFIVYTDIKTLKVHTIALIACLIVSIIRFFIEVEIKLASEMLLMNIIFIILVSAVVFLYALLRKVKFSQLAGIGDLLFIIVLIFCLAPFLFLLFITIASFLGLLHWLTFKKKPVPFAGIMAMLLIIIFIIDKFSSFVALDDSKILHLLYGL